MSGAADLRESLSAVGYVADEALAAALYLARQLQRPLLLEGEAGTGKTTVAQALAEVAGAELIRLQCYEGLDAQTTLYEWNYQKQLLAIKAREGGSGNGNGGALDFIFSEDFLLERPLLSAIRRERPPVLLVDEIDRADEEFEAYLLELLSEYQVSVPELGVLKALTIPIVILTSNSTRALSNALRRRCLYYYLEYPDTDKELAIIRAHLPQVDVRLAGQGVRFVRELRREELEKKPGISETLDWIAALARLRIVSLDGDEERGRLADSLTCLLKTAADRQALPPQKAALLAARVA